MIAARVVSASAQKSRLLCSILAALQPLSASRSPKQDQCSGVASTSGLAEVEADRQILADGVGELVDVAVHLNGVTRRPGAVQEPSPGGLHQVTIVAKASEAGRV